MDINLITGTPAKVSVITR